MALKPREVIFDTVSNPTLADNLYQQALTNYEGVADAGDGVPGPTGLPLESEEQLRAWASGAAVVAGLIKGSDRRAVNDQLWSYCFDPVLYPLVLRTVYGGANRPHSTAVLDWALPPLAIAEVMGRYGFGPTVSVLSAEQAGIRLNGLDPEAAPQHAADTLELIRKVAAHAYPGATLEAAHLDWETLTAAPYAADAEILHSRAVSPATLDALQALEAMVARKGGDPAAVAGYLALHNTAYGVYGGPLVKMAGPSEARFTRVQAELAAHHPELVGTIDMHGHPRLVAGTITSASSTAPYLLESGITAASVLEGSDGVEDKLDVLLASSPVGQAAAKVLQSLSFSPPKA